jgi:23S rRNA (cytosine1962-C5)-methyltransferase
MGSGPVRVLDERQRPELILEVPDDWEDYELLDSGNRAKLERFGSFVFVRPEPQAGWRRSLPEEQWREADAEFRASSGGDRGSWRFRNQIDPRWQMCYGDLCFWARATPFRHLGVFPEQARQWDWIGEQVRGAGRPVNVLNLFGYTGLATLAAAQAGARVTHVDSSKKMVAWARENQALSSLEDRSIRWIVDDSMKFVAREARRGARYDGFVLDPPRLGRGPDGEQWRLEQHLPVLLDRCREIVSASPLFISLTVYAIRFSPVSLLNLLEDFVGGLAGTATTGEMGLPEVSAGRTLSQSIFARWSAGDI